LAPADFEPLLALMRETLALPGLDGDRFARDFLLVPGFRFDHVLAAAAEGRLAGFMLVPRNDPLGAPEHAWIAAFGVDPALRRRGVATALLATAVEALRAEGIREVEVADVPVRYIFPGVDREAYPGAVEFLTRRGFTVTEEVASMGRALDGAFPTAPAIRVVRPGEYPLVRDFFADGFDAGWWGYFERSIFARLSGDPTPSDTLGWFEGGRLLGVVHYRDRRFGPLAVGPAHRGRGIGAALTLAALAEMRRAGLDRAYFLVGRDDVQRFYARLGFTVLRRFTRLRRAL
jgi:ribosomal protein S18 acetylase RimI-like enzyme